jgi:hypothetical protein
MAVRVVDDREGYVLLARPDDRYTVVERRAGRFYNLHGRGPRGGVPCEPDAALDIVDEGEWVDELKARATLHEAVRRHEDLARRIW